MHRLEPAKEGKLRAACDRCHDLKNRCVRTGGFDSRCDRCERLDIDCVYRNTSRIGRPRTQRRTSAVSQSQPPGRKSYQDESQEASRRRGPSKESLDASGSAADINQTETEASGNTTLIGSPSDVILVSPEIVQEADMDWSLNFSHHINSCVSEPLYQDAPQPLPGSSEAFSSPDSGSVANTEQTADKLLQLQGRLHRLLWSTDREPAADLVEESLEVVKTFLEILQAALAAQGPLPSDCGGPSATVTAAAAAAAAATTTTTTTGWLAGNSGGIATDCTGGGGTISSASSAAVPLKQQDAALSVSYITAQHALTCYSYILLMLDRVVSVLTSSNYGSTTGHINGESSSAALSLGFFNLGSQPALNAEVVLHLVLCMVQRLRVLIQLLVSGCKDLADRSSTSSSSTVVLDGLPRKGPPAMAPIAVTFHAIADLVGEKERFLVERLSCLTGGLQEG